MINTNSNHADRSAGCIVGAFIGDALGLGPHWYYDLDDLRRDFGPWINDYTTPLASRKYHAGMKAGELSQTGIIMKMLLRSVAEQGTYDEADFTHLLDEELLPNLSADPFSGPGGYTNHSFRQVWQTRVVEKKSWAEAGGNADTSEAAERISILAAAFAAEPYLAAKHALDCCHLTQTDPLVAQQSVAFACVLAALVRGEAFDEQLSDKLMELVDNGTLPFVAKSSIVAAEKKAPNHPSDFRRPMPCCSPHGSLRPRMTLTFASSRRGKSRSSTACRARSISSSPPPIIWLCDSLATSRAQCFMRLTAAAKTCREPASPVPSSVPKSDSAASPHGSSMAW